VLADFYAVLKDEQINLINEAVKFYRDTAWLFAVVLAASPSIADPAAITLRDFQVEQQGFLIYNPRGAIATVVNAIAARESRDVVTNIRALDRIASELTPITTIL
jgi:hypothetical protein